MTNWFHPVDRFFGLILAIWIVCVSMSALIIPYYFWIPVAGFTFGYYPRVMRRCEQDPDRYALKLFFEYLLVVFMFAIPGIYITIHLILLAPTTFLGVVASLSPIVISVLVATYLSKRYIYWRYSEFIGRWEKKNKRKLL